MTVLMIVVAVFVLAVLVIGFRYDRKQRTMGAGGGVNKSMRSTRVENSTTVSKWGAGGAG